MGVQHLHLYKAAIFAQTANVHFWKRPYNAGIPQHGTGLNKHQRWQWGLKSSELLCWVAGLLIPGISKERAAFSFKGDAV